MTERDIRERYPAARDEILRRGGPRISLAEYRTAVLQRVENLRQDAQRETRENVQIAARLGLRR